MTAPDTAASGNARKTCAVCGAPLEPTEALPGAYVHVDDEHEDHRPVIAEAACQHCGRTIVNQAGRWIDPEATGDDSVWRETCDSHDTFTAEHEPTERGK